MNTSTDLIRGQLLGSAIAVLTAYDYLAKGNEETIAWDILNAHVDEMHRVIENTLQYFGTAKGDPIVTASLIVLLVLGYIPKKPEGK